VGGEKRRRALPYGASDHKRYLRDIFKKHGLLTRLRQIHLSTVQRTDGALFKSVYLDNMSSSSIVPFEAAVSVVQLTDDSWSGNLVQEYCVGAGSLSHGIPTRDIN